MQALEEGMGVCFPGYGRRTWRRVESPIKTMCDFECYTPPDPHFPERFADVEDAVQILGAEGCYCPP